MPAQAQLLNLDSSMSLSCKSQETDCKATINACVQAHNCFALFSMHCPTRMGEGCIYITKKTPKRTIEITYC